MLFTSYEFLIFAALLLGLYYIIPKRFQWMLLLLASYLFYWIANPAYLLFIGITTISVYAAARLMEQNAERQADYIKQHKEELSKEEKKEYKKQQKKIRFRLAALFVCLNIAILAVVKYTNFFFSIFAPVISLFSGSKEIPSVSLLVPMGISFYTFQAVGYLVDVYRGTIKAEKNLFKFALFISFFPQLVQGPISRFDELGQSLFAEKKFDKEKIYLGLQRILWGYFKKLVVADRILIAVNEIIRNPEQYQGTYVFLGALFYAIELYADFTGGIDITIGIGELFGIQFAENFRQPFFSKSIKEYWTRWHISMGTWFRDYIFYPVSVCGWMKKSTAFVKKKFGKKAGKKFPVYLSSLLVWLLTGLWHGASWNFIAWGLGNFFLIFLSEECQPLVLRFYKKFPELKQKKLFSAFQIMRTFLLMSMLRMFDCYTSVTETFRMFCSIFFRWNPRIFLDGSLLKLGLTMADYGVILVGCIVMFTVSFCQKTGSVRLQLRKQNAGIRFCVWYGMFLAILMFGMYGTGYDAAQFIYNQY